MCLYNLNVTASTKTIKSFLASFKIVMKKLPYVQTNFNLAFSVQKDPQRLTNVPSVLSQIDQFKDQHHLLLQRQQQRAGLLNKSGNGQKDH